MSNLLSPEVPSDQQPINHKVIVDKSQLPLVSVIINNYNYAAFIRQAIESCLQQTYPKTEIIVVDDGSTDDSLTIISSYSAKITTIFKPNGGQASAMNSGFEVSSGEIIIFLDADDYLFPEAIQEIVNHWDPSIVQLQYRLNLVDQHGEFIDVLPSKTIQFHTGEVWPIILQNGRQQTTVTSGNAFNRSALIKILPIPELEFCIAADGYLVSLIPFWGSVSAIEYPLGVYRQHSSNHWSVSSVGDIKALLNRLHRAIEHDYHRYHWIQQQASSLGHLISQELAFQDYIHLINRMGSLCLHPQKHPFPLDSSKVLALAGIKAVCNQSTLWWGRKWALVLWFLTTGFTPSRISTLLTQWFLLANSRPRFIQTLISNAKRIQRIVALL